MKKTILLITTFLSMNAYSLTIHCGNLLDVNSGKMKSHVYIETENGQFKNIEDYNQQKVDLDLSEYYCLPGLIDMQTHLSFEFSENSYS